MTRRSPKRPPSRVRVTVVGTRLPAAAAGLGAWLANAAPRSASGTVTIALVSDRDMARLNGEFRGKPVATDVLSFPSGERPAPGAGGAHGRRTARETGLKKVATRGAKLKIDNDLGDIAIARGVAARQARRERHPLRTELRVLALHGILHLLGYDHDRDSGEMRALEERLRRRAGLPAGLVARASRPVERR